MSSLRPWLALIVFVVAGCHSPGNGAAATPGKASIEFGEFSESALTVTVVNGRSGAIYIRGTRRFPWGPIEVLPEFLDIRCRATADEQAFTLIAVTPENGPFVEVPPGQRATVRVETTSLPPLRGAECSVTVLLKDGIAAVPAKFVVPKR